MNVEQFENLRNFSAIENWGDISIVKWYHVHHLFLIRSKINWPMAIHCCASTSGHSENSFHYKGLATDFHFVTADSLVNQFSKLEGIIDSLGLTDFLGVGVYPEWRPYPGGFHIDSRGSRIRWIRKDGIYKYGDNENIISNLS